MARADQDARGEALRSPTDTARVKLLEVDLEHTSRIRALIGRHGWPTRKLVGEDGARAAWLLVQHADSDHAFQERCVMWMAEAVQAGEASPADLAYLIDRVLTASRRPQIYGTQFSKVDGKLTPRPIQDPAGVDRRRRAVGLSALREYWTALDRDHASSREGAPWPR
jgi:hypothetical protein